MGMPGHPPQKLRGYSVFAPELGGFPTLKPLHSPRLDTAAGTAGPGPPTVATWALEDMPQAEASRLTEDP